MPSTILRYSLSLVVILTYNALALLQSAAVAEPSPGKGTGIVPGYEDPVVGTKSASPQLPTSGQIAITTDGGARGTPEGFFVCNVYDPLAKMCLVKMPTVEEIEAAKIAAAHGTPWPRPKNKYGMFGLTDSKLNASQAALVKCLAENGAATPLHEWDGRVNMSQIKKYCNEQLRIEEERAARAREDASSRPLSPENIAAAMEIYRQVKEIAAANQQYAGDNSGRFAGNVQELAAGRWLQEPPAMLPGLLVPVSLVFENQIVAYLTHDAGEICRALNKSLGFSWKEVPFEPQGVAPGETTHCYRLSNGMYRFDYRGN